MPIAWTFLPKRVPRGQFGLHAFTAWRAGIHVGMHMQGIAVTAADRRATSAPCSGDRRALKTQLPSSSKYQLRPGVETVG